jgi:hypothetical protein
VNKWLTDKLEPVLSDDDKVFGKPMNMQVVNKFNREVFSGTVKGFLENNMSYYVDQQIETVAKPFGLNLTDLERDNQL